jgi:hypothetical protein
MPEDGSQYCSPRNLVRAGKVISRLKRGGVAPAPDMVAGSVGEATAGDLVLYHDTVGELVPFADVLKNPAFIKQMGDPGLIFAYLVQAAVHAKEDPDTVKAWATKLHGELKETLALLAGW